ncbi:MAG TPA: NAD-dependent epimerase/dehydratase family protein [Ktedonobacteraceae bacterium]|jgi:nucleoside-diphosphate-sugar epimerase|nr:NAD-dependent epimerase/dehydratase family protein [Ktedonobacteraceae bacterium]
MTRVAITGCASRFAQVLLPLLEKDPDVKQIVGIDLAPPATTYEKMQFHRCDVRAPELGNLLAGCDTLVHLAFIVTRPYALSLAEAASINLAGTWNVCRTAAEMGVRKLVVSSSVAAYGVLPDNPAWLVEESPLRGLYTDFYYSQHKHANEIWLDGLQLAFPTLIITRLRPCIVMGPHQSGLSLLASADGVHVTSAEAYHTRLQFVHEDDLASAFHAAIRHDLLGAYNVVGDGAEALPKIAADNGLQVIELPREMLRSEVEKLWKAGQSNAGPEWLWSEGELLCSNARLKATGYWQPRYSTVEACAATLAALP